MATPIRCPSCQSLDVVVQGTAGHCQACGRRLEVSGDRAIVVAGPQRGVAWAPVVGVIALLAAGGWWVSRPTAPAEAPPAAAVVAPTTTPAAGAAAPVGQGVPHAVVSDVREGSTAIGGRYWIATYRNDGPVAIDRPGIVVKLVDSGGAVKAEVRGDGPFERLDAGQSMPVFALITEPPKGLAAQVEVVPPVAATGAAWKSPLLVEGLAHKKHPLGTTVVVGEIVNPHPQRGRFVDIAVVGLDVDGKPVSWGSGLPTIADLDPKGRAPFQVRMGTFEVEEPATYAAWASANLK